MRRGLALVLVALAGAALTYLAVVEAAVARIPPTPVENGLEARDLRVSRALASTLPDLRSAPTPPALVVLVTPPTLPEAERNALKAYVEAGGELWVLSPSPSARALWSDDNLKAGTLRGFLYASDGSLPTLTIEPGDLSLSGLGFLALDVGAAYSEVLRADTSAFRDTNGNGRLDTGEPGGPFTVGAAARVGEGRVVVLGTEDATILPSALSTGLTRDLREGSVLILDANAPGGWAAPGIAVLALASLPAGSLVAAALLLLAAAALLLLVLPRGERDAADADAPAFRLASAYAERLRERARPEDKIILQSLEGDNAP